MAGAKRARTLRLPPSERQPSMTDTISPSQYRNGVDTQQMYGTLDAIKDDPSLGRFQFRVSNRWIDGSHNRSTIQSFYGAGQEDSSRREAFVIDAGEPAILLGHEPLALAACLTTSIVYVAAARKVNLSSVE